MVVMRIEVGMERGKRELLGGGGTLAIFLETTCDKN